MAKQKCGTCRFFQEAGLAGSGWCHHPQRKVSSDVMIMVRRNELACRDEWSRSLWAAAEPGQHAPEEAFQRAPHLGPLPPAEADDLQALARAEEIPSVSNEGEDVLLSEARIVSEYREPPVSHAPSIGNFDPRTAVFRARERYRDRNRARESAARQSGAALPLSAVAKDVEEPDEAHFETQAEPEVTPILDREALGATAVEPALSGHEQIDQAESSQHAMAIPREEQTWSLEQFLSDTSKAIEEQPVSDEQPELALETLSELDERNLPAWFRTDLPRICRTCRDFRPAADGRRGWCANSWAFTHRRMVNDDEPTPCDSSIGDWWVAVDDVWLVAADVSAHGRATPLLDRLTGKQIPERKRS